MRRGIRVSEERGSRDVRVSRGVEVSCGEVGNGGEGKYRMGSEKGEEK